MRISPLAPALLLILLTAGCMSDDVVAPTGQPDPPPAAAFDADFSFFHSQSPAADGATSSWTEALETVELAAAAMAVLEVPEALVRAASAAQGTADGAGWTWPFSTTVDGEPYEGELRSRVAGSFYQWDLIVSAPDHSPQLTNYLWAQGTSVPGGHEGAWALADAGAGSDSLAARVSWVRNGEDRVTFGFSASDTAGWTYERTEAGNALTYYVFSTPEYRVTWNPATGAGGSWTSATGQSCWDQNQHDIAC